MSGSQESIDPKIRKLKNQILLDASGTVVRSETIGGEFVVGMMIFGCKVVVKLNSYYCDIYAGELRSRDSRVFSQQAQTLCLSNLFFLQLPHIFCIHNIRRYRRIVTELAQYK